MLELKKEFNNILYEDECILNGYFPVYFAESIGTCGKCISWKNVHWGERAGLLMSLCRLAEQGSF